MMHEDETMFANLLKKALRNNEGFATLKPSELK